MFSKLCKFAGLTSPDKLLFIAGLCVSGMLILTSNTQATRIYKSIDADGNVTYSSTPPDDATQIQRIDLPPAPVAEPDTGGNSIIEKIKAAAHELENDRKQREQEREAARKALAEEETKQPPAEPAESTIHYYPAFPPYYRHPGKPRPPHPPRYRPRPHPHPPVHELPGMPAP